MNNRFLTQMKMKKRNYNLLIIKKKNLPNNRLYQSKAKLVKLDFHTSNQKYLNFKTI